MIGGDDQMSASWIKEYLLDFAIAWFANNLNFYQHIRHHTTNPRMQRLAKLTFNLQGIIQVDPQ